MKNNTIKISALVVVVASVSILLGIALYKIQIKPALPVEPSLTQASSTPSAMPPLPTSPPLSAAMLENLFGNSLCSWPCWQGITPAITTSSEALQRLNDSPVVLKSSIQSEGSETGLGKADWRWAIGGKQPMASGKMEWENGIVGRIELTPYLSIGEIIGRFGPPEKIGVIDCSDIPESLQWCAILYYAKNGFQIHIRWAGFEAQILPSDPINFIVLSVPSFNDNWLSFKGLNLRDWKGYGNLNDLYVR
jgi:hypothetical protein